MSVSSPLRCSEQVQPKSNDETFSVDCREQGSYFPLAAVGMGSGCCYDCRFLEPYVSRQKFALSKRELTEFLCPRSPPSSFIHSIYMLYLDSCPTPQPRPNLGGFGLNRGPREFQSSRNRSSFRRADIVPESSVAGYGRWGGSKFDAAHLEDIFSALDVSRFSCFLHLSLLGLS